MWSKVEDIVIKSLVKILPPIIGELDYKLINEAVKILYSNAVTLLTTLRKGGHVHTRIIMKPTL